MVLGMTVARSRVKYMDKAEKDGEELVKERYAYPNLYAQGTSKNARAFNCVQRSHQQILETFTGYLMTALLAGLEFPVSVSLFGALWLYSRTLWVQGYMESEGAPSKRYDHPFAGFFWTAMLVVWMMCCLSAISVLLGRNIFWDGILSGEFLSKRVLQ